jgi:hypothetical protein
MDVKGILVQAEETVREAGIPDDLRVTAFAKAVDLISGPGRSAGESRGSSAVPARAGSDDAEDALDEIGQKLKLEPEIIGEVFHEEDGEIEITVPSAKLDAGKKGGTRQLALLIAAGRQGAGLEEFTSLDVVRKVAEDYRRYDQANFAKAINEMSDVFNFRGTGRGRSVKVSRPGWEAATQLVKALGGGEN